MEHDINNISHNKLELNSIQRDIKKLNSDIDHLFFLLYNKQENEQKRAMVEVIINKFSSLKKCVKDISRLNK